MVNQQPGCNYPSIESKVIHLEQRLKCKYSIQKACKRARSLARIKVSAFGAGDRGFKSHRARQHMYETVPDIFLFFLSLTIRDAYCDFFIHSLHPLIL